MNRWDCSLSAASVGDLFHAPARKKSLANDSLAIALMQPDKDRGLKVVFLRACGRRQPYGKLVDGWSEAIPINYGFAR